MEYVRKNGTKVIVEGDNVQYGEGKFRKSKIGANFVNGIIIGGQLSSFNESFSEEIINIQSGLGDIVNAKMGDISDAYELLKFKINNVENPDIYELSCLVLDTVDEFFGGISNIEKRFDYYYPSDFDESENNKISNLKNTGAAMCVERSALAQNLLKFLGLNSFYKSSGILKNGIKEVHSYNLVEYDGKYYIFDSSIPNLINEQISPLIAEIDKKTFILLSSPIPDIGISITVSHYNPYRNVDVTITYDSCREIKLEINALDGKPPKHL